MAVSGRMQVLGLLRAKGPLRTSDVGWALWGQSTTAPERGQGAQRENKFCQTAGRLLHELQRIGRVEAQTRGDGVWWYAVPPRTEMLLEGTKR